MTNKLLSNSERQALSVNLPEWEINENNLIRSFKFDNFVEAFEFMTRVAIIAEEINHHPDWSNSYSTVDIKLTTHDLGGLSLLDLKLAQEINSLSKTNNRKS